MKTRALWMVGGLPLSPHLPTNHKARGVITMRHGEAKSVSWHWILRFDHKCSCEHFSPVRVIKQGISMCCLQQHSVSTSQARLRLEAFNVTQLHPMLLACLLSSDCKWITMNTPTCSAVTEARTLDTNSTGSRLASGRSDPPTTLVHLQDGCRAVTHLMVT